jgi:hypothetical protein
MKRHLKPCRVWVLAAALALILWVPPAMAMQEEIVGTVIDSGAGFAVISECGEYLTPDINLAKYVGETVALTGDVEVGADSLALDHIDSIQVLSVRNLIDPAPGTLHSAP